jgi:hypothetical protein
MVASILSSGNHRLYKVHLRLSELRPDRVHERRVVSNLSKAAEVVAWKVGLKLLKPSCLIHEIADGTDTLYLHLML